MGGLSGKASSILFLCILAVYGTGLLSKWVAWDDLCFMNENSNMYVWEQMKKNKGINTWSGAPDIEKNLKSIQKLEVLRLNLKSQCHLISLKKT